MKWLIPALTLFAVGCPKPPPPPPPIIKPVFFDSGETDFATPAEDKAVVTRAANILDTTTFSLVCVGLADSAGDPAANKVLAMQRAEKVCEMVNSQSKAGKARLHTFAMGEQLATGEHQGERKVEFVFYRDNGQPIAQVVENARTLKDDRIDKSQDNKKDSKKK